LVDRRPVWADVFYFRMWNSDRVFPYNSICTELQCRMYCCEIQTNIRFVTLNTVSTSCVTVNVTVNINFSVTLTTFGHFDVLC